MPTISKIHNELDLIERQRVGLSYTVHFSPNGNHKREIKLGDSACDDFTKDDLKQIKQLLTDKKE